MPLVYVPPANNLQSLGLTPRNSLVLLGANEFANTCGEQSISVIEFDLVKDLSSQFGHPPGILEEKMNVWKRGFADVLRDSPVTIFF